MNKRTLILPLAMACLLSAASVRADTLGTAIGGGVGAIAGAVIGDSMG